MRYGASSFVYGWERAPDGRELAGVVFELHHRRVRFKVPMPAETDREVMRTPTGIQRSPTSRAVALEQARRQRWRALLLVVTAKLEAIEVGIETVDEAFLAHVVMPTGATVGEWVTPQLEAMVAAGKMPDALPLGLASRTS